MNTGYLALGPNHLLKITEENKLRDSPGQALSAGSHREDLGKVKVKGADWTGLGALLPLEWKIRALGWRREKKSYYNILCYFIK